MDNMEQKTSPTTFRITPTTNTKFKELAQVNGLTQDEMLGNLIATYELENAKALIVNREKEIEEFQGLATRLINIYLNSLELNQNSELRIQEKFSAQLDKKIELVSILQEEIKGLKSSLTEQDGILANTLNQNAKLSEECEALKDTLDTKEKLIKEYIDKIDTITSLVAEYTEYKTNYINLKNELEIVKNEKEQLSHEYKNLELEKANLDERLIFLNTQIGELKESQSQLNLEHKEYIKQIKAEHKEEVFQIKQEHKEKLNLMDKELGLKTMTFEKELEKSNSIFQNTLNEIKENLHNQHTNEIEKLTLNYEKILFEKDKELEQIDRRE